MSTHVQVKNLTMHWRHKRSVKVTVQMRGTDGIWRDSVMDVPMLLGAQHSTNDTWLHENQRLIVEETHG